MTALRRDREQANGKITREWVWVRWFRPVAPLPVPAGMSHAEITTTIEQAAHTARTALEVQTEALFTRMRTRDTEMGEHMHTLRTEISEQMRALRMRLEILEAQDHRMDTDQPMRDSEARRAQGARTSPSAHRAQKGTDQPMAQEQGSAPTRIWAALQRLDVDLSETQIAREVGCSRKTVARWRKRFEGQGPLGMIPAVAQAPAEVVERPSQPPPHAEPPEHDLLTWSTLAEPGPADGSR